MSSNSGNIPSWIVELAAFECFENSPRGKWCQYNFSAILYQNVFILAGNKDNHKILDMFENPISDLAALDCLI